MNQTVPDRILEKARKSKLGRLANGPSVEDPNEKSQRTSITRQDHDYK
jgi:hypothetical protein